MKIKELSLHITLIVFALAATAWISSQLLDVAQQDTSTIADNVVGVEPAYAADEPTPCGSYCDEFR